jgi:hypothetical protein
MQREGNSEGKIGFHALHRDRAQGNVDSHPFNNGGETFSSLYVVSRGIAVATALSPGPNEGFSFM